MKKNRMIQRCSILVLVLMMMSLTVSCSSEPENVIPEVRKGVVRILAYDPETGANATGSGFGVGIAGEETEYFVTNWHVVTAQGQYPIGAMEIYILLTNDAVKGDSSGLYFDPSETIKCQVVYSAEKFPDVAILKAEKKVPGRVALTLMSSRYVKEASKVYSLGYPGAADVTSYSDDNQTNYLYADVESVHINGGVISKGDAFEVFNGTYCLEHDAHINGGNSGGPLINEEGYVVGINTYTAAADAFLNYSVYIDYAMDYMNQLGIAYDYVVLEESFPVVLVAIGAGIVLVTAVVVTVLLVKSKKSAKQPAVDTGLRVQYSGDSMMAGKRIVINGTLRFGRAEDCNVRYQNGASGISGHHCEIIVDKGQAYIRDLNSTHGTYINGNRIASNQQIPLAVGTQVYLGSMKECFQIVRSTKS